MSRFLHAFLVGGISAGTVTFALYASMQQDTDRIRSSVDRIHSTLDPSLRFHLLKDTRVNDDHSTGQWKVLPYNQEAVTDSIVAQLKEYKGQWNGGIERLAQWLYATVGK